MTSPKADLGADASCKVVGDRKRNDNVGYDIVSGSVTESVERRKNYRTESSLEVVRKTGYGT